MQPPAVVATTGTFTLTSVMIYFDQILHTYILLNIGTGVQNGEDASTVLRGSSIKTIRKPGLLHAKT